MKGKTRVMILSLIVSVLVFLWIERNMPLLSPQMVYGFAAGIGFIVGVILNYLWVNLSKRGV